MTPGRLGHQAFPTYRSGEQAFGTCRMRSRKAQASGDDSGEEVLRENAFAVSSEVAENHHLVGRAYGPGARTPHAALTCRAIELAL
jgi:hypothetical protein